MELKNVKGIGNKTLYYLNNANIYTISDMVYHFPLEYIIYEEDYDKFIRGENTYIEGVISTKVSMYRYRGKAYAFSFMLKNDFITTKINLFTTLYAGINLKYGMKIGIYGKLNIKEKYFSAKKIFIDNLGFKIDTDYKINDIQNKTFQRIINNIINSNIKFEETLPIELINKYNLLNIDEYIKKSHNPNTYNDVKEVLRRRKYEEFYWYSISFDLIREKRLSLSKKIRNIDFKYLDDFMKEIPFELTTDQLGTFNDIRSDLSNPYPMNRLVQGDVSCGKTIIAVGISYLLAKNNYQIAIMVPTEVLSIQHYNTFKSMLLKYNIIVERIYGGMKKKEYDDILYRLVNNRINILIGTHALLNDSINFSKLGLVIIDEQHKFGVNQRLMLLNKYNGVDSLFLSATPIPRTLGLTFFKDLDISSIKTMPKGRKEITTKIIDINNLKPLFGSILNHLKMGEEAYIVCPLIDNNEDLNYMNLDECIKIVEENLGQYQYRVLHGRMKREEKDSAIDDFKTKKAQILISTTVIEVGVNVEAATMMIIMSAERFGLATLHQLRGRVGRSNLNSYCMLVTNDIENERLNALVNYSSGFDISEIDFKLRGPGDYLGELQSGFRSSLIYSDFKNDLNILKCAKEDSKEYIKKYINKEIKSDNFNKILELSNSKIDKIN